MKFSRLPATFTIVSDMSNLFITLNVLPIERKA